MLNFILFKDFCGLHITIQKGVFFTEYKRLAEVSSPVLYCTMCNCTYAKYCHKPK